METLNKKELFSVGKNLGLMYSNLRKMNGEHILDEVVHSWLRKDDIVMTISGEPSWDSLSQVLEKNHKGIATEIRNKGKTVFCSWHRDNCFHMYLYAEMKK